MALNVKKLKKIRRFGKFRFHGDVRYNEDVLIKIYEMAEPKKKVELDKEMTLYLQAIEAGKLQPGESILKLAFVEEEEESSEVTN